MNKAIYKARVFGPAGCQGSNRIVSNKHTGQSMMIEASKDGRKWRGDMINSMLEDKPAAPFNEAMMVYLRVYISRPKAQYNSRGQLKPNAPKYPALKSKDVDKIQRSVGDAAKIAKWVTDDGLLNWYAIRYYTEDIAMPERTDVTMYSLEKFN